MSEIIKTLPVKIEYIKSAPDFSFVHNGKRVLICTCTHQWIEFFAYLACVLLHRGCRVDFVWSAYYETDNVNQVNHANLMFNVFEPIFNSLYHDRLRVMQLKDIPMANINEAILREMIALSTEDTVRIAYEIRVDHQSKHNRLFNRRLHCNHEVMASLLYLHQQNNYDTALTFSGKSCEMGATFRLMNLLGVPMCTIEDLPFGKESAVRKSWRYPAVVLSEETTKEDWEKRKTFEVTEKTIACNNMFKKRLNTLENPYSSFQFVKDGQVNQIIQQLNINKKIPTILILPSFTFELHYWVNHYVFKDSVEWFNETLEYLANRSDCEIIVRSHPYPGYTDEKEDPLGLSVSNETPGALIKKLFDKIPRNIRFISATDKVNTYDLMEIADMAICYTSTAGLEMAVRGKASIVPTSAHYTGKGFTFSPRGREEYFQLIGDLIKHPDKMRLSKKQIDLAQCYIETTYFDSVMSLPWTVTAPNLYSQWPIERLISLEGVLSIYTDNIDSIVHEEHKISIETKLKEFNSILDTLRKFKTQNMWEEAKLLLGDFSKIDLNFVSVQYPSVYNAIIANCDELIEIAIYDAKRETLDLIKLKIEEVIQKFNENSSQWRTLNNCLNRIPKVVPMSEDKTHQKIKNNDEYQCLLSREISRYCKIFRCYLKSEIG